MGAFNSGETLRIITLLYNSMLRSKSLQSYISHAKISGNQFLCWSSAIVSSEKLEKIGRILRFHIGIKYQTRYLYLYPPHFEKPLSLSLTINLRNVITEYIQRSKNTRLKIPFLISPAQLAAERGDLIRGWRASSDTRWYVKVGNAISRFRCNETKRNGTERNAVTRERASNTNSSVEPDGTRLPGRNTISSETATKRISPDRVTGSAGIGWKRTRRKTNRTVSTVPLSLPLFLPLPSPTNRVSSSYAAHNRSKTFCHAALDKLASERAIYALPLSPFQRHAFTSPVCLIGRYRSEAESCRDGRELFFSSFSFSLSSSLKWNWLFRFGKTLDRFFVFRTSFQTAAVVSAVVS